MYYDVVRNLVVWRHFNRRNNIWVGPVQIVSCLKQMKPDTRLEHLQLLQTQHINPNKITAPGALFRVALPSFRVAVV